MNTDARQPVLPHIPSSFQLAEIVDRVVSDWVFFSARPAGKPAPGPAPLSLEHSVALNGPVDCVLVVRANPAFAADLAQAFGREKGAAADATDAFREFCNLVAGHLLSTCMGEAEYAAFLPTASTPEEWPSAPPQAEAVVLVENHVLEVRLWAWPKQGAAYA